MPKSVSNISVQPFSQKNNKLLKHFKESDPINLYMIFAMHLKHFLLHLCNFSECCKNLGVIDKMGKKSRREKNINIVCSRGNGSDSFFQFPTKKRRKKIHTVMKISWRWVSTIQPASLPSSLSSSCFTVLYPLDLYPIRCSPSFLHKALECSWLWLTPPPPGSR